MMSELEFQDENTQLVNSHKKRCCCSHQTSEPLGLQKGSVRAILTLIIVPMIVLTQCGIMIYGISVENYKIVNVLNPSLALTLGSVIGYYFGHRAGMSERNV